MQGKTQGAGKDILNSKFFNTLFILAISVIVGMVSLSVMRGIDATYLRKDVFKEWTQRQEERTSLLLQRQDELTRDMKDVSSTLKSIETSLRFLEEKSNKASTP